MSVLERKVKLNDGTEIPVLGLGTWQTDPKVTARVVKDAIDAGYRHIDTASAYQNEAGVGEGIRASGIDREKIYVTSKIRAELKTFEEARDQIKDSLDKLGTGYIDLMLIHAPVPWREMGDRQKGNRHADNREVWRALEEAVREGRVRSIGISNFNNDDTQNILNHCSIRPAVNQICYHIGYREPEIADYCHRNGILVEAYSPIATGELLKNEEVKAVAEKYNVSTAQLSIAFTLQECDISLPKTTHKEYMIENAKVDFTISDEDMETLRHAKPVVRH
jgi:diketogulonate reductase-like aldo/keto reductase